MKRPLYAVTCEFKNGLSGPIKLTHNVKVGGWEGSSYPTGLVVDGVDVAIFTSRDAAKRYKYDIEHLGCRSYQNCDEDPGGCTVQSKPMLGEF